VRRHTTSPPPRRCLQWVDPFIGTGGKGYGTGSAFPGPQVPFGLARPGPDTGLVGGTAVSFAHCSGYNFEDNGRPRLQPDPHARHRHRRLRPGLVHADPRLHARQGRAPRRDAVVRSRPTSGQPGLLRVTLADGVGVELTATDRVGLHRFSFPAGKPAAVVLDLGRTLPDVEVVAAELHRRP
jgi:putative alpha-1,2-mannosidase